MTLELQVKTVDFQITAVVLRLITVGSYLSTATLCYRSTQAAVAPPLSLVGTSSSLSQKWQVSLHLAIAVAAASEI